MNPHAPTFRRLMLESMETAPADAAILLSGGIDSASILAASLALGRRPLCVTANLGLDDSDDTIAAREQTHAFDVEHVVVHVDDSPAHRDWLVETAVGLAHGALLNCGGHEKTHVEVLGSLLETLEYLSVRGVPNALNGMSAGDAFGDSRKAHVYAAEHGQEAARVWRLDDLSTELPTHSDNTLRYVSNQLGVTQVDAYRLEPVNAWLRERTFADLSIGYRKSVAVEAFPEFFAGRWNRPHANLQIVGGFRDWFATLVAEGNPVRVYRQLLRDETARRTGAIPWV